MNKNKIYLTLAVLSLVGMIGQYMYYEIQVLADHGTNEYTITFNNPNAIRGLEQAENAQGCSKLHTDFDDETGQTGILTFTCDSRDPIPIPLRQLTQEQFIEELANERNIQIIP